MSSIVVRRPVVADVPAMARMHVQSWRETYRGLMPDAVVDDPGAVGRRESFWTGVLTDDRPVRLPALAERSGVVVGVALAGPPLDVTDAWARQLYVLYTLAEVHGSGAGAALMDAVLGVEAPVGLWVADPNPRAQAFYRRHGFTRDGRSRVDHGIRTVRMVRADPPPRP